MAEHEESSQEALTMQQRMDAFYRQSGGPNNPQIAKILEKHLLYGKDHGIPGQKETIQNAFFDTIVGDPSLLMMVQMWQQRKQKDLSSKGSTTPNPNQDILARLQSETTALRQEMTTLKALVEKLVEANTSRVEVKGHHSPTTREVG